MTTSARVTSPILSFWFAALPAAVALVAVPATLAIWSLEIQLRSGHLTVHLRPGMKRDTSWADVVSCEPRPFRPFREYLGWGFRVGPAGLRHR